MRSSRLALGAAVAFAALSPAAAHAATTPTASSLRADAGSYSLSRTVYADSATPGFGAATVFAPSGTSGQTFGVVAFAPGFTETTSSVSWLAQKVASFGFVTIAFNVNNTFTDFPTSRATQLLAALDFVTSTSNERTLADATREAVVGHSMGGGATLEASRQRPALKAAVGLEPWNPGISYSDVTVPQLEIGAQWDFIAPVANNAKTFYNSLPSTTPKVLAVLSGAGHFASNSPSARVGAATVAWLKRYVDGDTQYAPFICGSHTAIKDSELSSFASSSC
ncbi:MAG: hypothetical protein QM679_13015 [Patulibacter sp.]